MTHASFGITGLHRISCVAAVSARTSRFYAATLGLRESRHEDDAGLHFATDERCDASPTLSFRFDPQAGQGVHGGGQVGSLALKVPHGSLSYWRQRLSQRGCDVVGRAWAFDDEYMHFVDPDGLALFLVEERGSEATNVALGPEPFINGVFAIELDSLEPTLTARMLVDAFGLATGPRAGAIERFYAGTLAVDVLSNSRRRLGSQGLGNIEHIVWKVSDAETMGRIVTRLRATQGVELRSGHDGVAFFREPGGTCFALTFDGCDRR